MRCLKCIHVFQKEIICQFDFFFIVNIMRVIYGRRFKILYLNVCYFPGSILLREIIKKRTNISVLDRKQLGFPCRHICINNR